MKRQTGEYVAPTLLGIGDKAFVPLPLPPCPAIEFGEELQGLRGRANRALGRLDAITEILPATNLFLYQYVRKEAVLSSQIEGTQSSMSDLLLFELEEVPGVPRDDVQEMSNYVAALNHGIKRIREGFPLSLRLIREMHSILLSKGRGSDKAPGEFRKKQNWIDGAHPANAGFVPPPHELLESCIYPFEQFLHDATVPVLVKAALAHVQFESIHPFEDGNGRLGRLLVTLLLCAKQVLSGLNAPAVPSSGDRRHAAGGRRADHLVCAFHQCVPSQISVRCRELNQAAPLNGVREL